MNDPLKKNLTIPICFLNTKSNKQIKIVAKVVQDNNSGNSDIMATIPSFILEEIGYAYEIYKIEASDPWQSESLINITYIDIKIDNNVYTCLVEIDDEIDICVYKKFTGTFPNEIFSKAKSIIIEAPRVFLSHCHKDKGFVYELAKCLLENDIPVWIDSAEIKVGESLIEKIRNGIDKVKYVIATISKNSIESEWVKREIDVAMNIEIENKVIKVLPVLIDNTDLPGFLKGKLYVKFENGLVSENEMKRLINSLE